MRRFLGMGMILALYSGCNLSTEQIKDALGPGRDLLRMHQLYPTGWVTAYHVVLPDQKKMYLSDGRYELPLPFSPGQSQLIFKNLRTWSTEAYNLLVSIINHDPLFTYQLGSLQTQIAFKTTLQAPKTRETLTVFSDANVGGQLMYVDPRGQTIPFQFQLMAPASQVTVRNPFVTPPPATEGEASGVVLPALKALSIPSAQFQMYSSEAWSRAETHLTEPGFKLSGEASIDGQAQDMRVVARALSFLSTVRLGGIDHQLRLNSEPGLTYQLSPPDRSGLRQAEVRFSHQAEGSMDLAQTDYRFDGIRLQAAYVVRQAPAFLSKMGLAGSLVHKPSGMSLGLDTQNLLWMKQDPMSGRVFKSRNLFSGSIRGKIPGLTTAGTSELSPGLTVDSFEVYLDGGERLVQELPEMIHILIRARGVHIDFGELRSASNGAILRPLSVSLSFRALLRLNLAQQTFWSRDNGLMVSVDYLGFEGDGAQISLQLDPRLKHESSGIENKTLLEALEAYIRKDQSEHIVMISGEDLRRLNEEGDVPPIVATLRDRLSLIRIEKFDEQRWQEMFGRAQNLEHDFELGNRQEPTR